VVSTRACANQFLLFSSSGIALFGMRTVQADSCLISEQIDTLLICEGGQEGGFGGGGDILGRRPKKCTWVSGIYFIAPSCPNTQSHIYNVYDRMHGNHPA